MLRHRNLNLVIALLFFLNCAGIINSSPDWYNDERIDPGMVFGKGEYIGYSSNLVAQTSYYKARARLLNQIEPKIIVVVDSALSILSIENKFNFMFIVKSQILDSCRVYITDVKDQTIPFEGRYKSFTLVRLPIVQVQEQAFKVLTLVHRREGNDPISLDKIKQLVDSKAIWDNR